MSTVSLYSLKEGARGRVTRLLVQGPMRRRLQDIGLVEGTYVICLGRSPSGDPIAYYIRGAVIAIRAQDSSQILIE